MAFFQTKHLWVKQLDGGVAVLMLDRDQSAVNFLDLGMLDDLARALDAVAKAGDFRLLVLRSAKTANFCGGPGPEVLVRWNKDEFTSWSARGQELCNQLANLSTPSACVLSGGCFDAGLELALACDHRVVVNTPAAMFGFAALEWGMIPCWGGTQRLPHLIGLDNSLQMLLAGQRLDARQAWTRGLADDLVDSENDEPPTFLANPVKRDWTTFPRRNWRERLLESSRAGRWFLFRGAERILRTRIPEEMPAQAESLHALRLAYQGDGVTAGLAHEREAMARIAEHPALSNLVRLLVHREALRTPSQSADGKPIRVVGVRGTGTAGLSLLLHCLVKGHETVLRAEDETALGAGLTQVVQLLQAEVQRGAMTPAVFQKLLGSIRGTYTWTNFERLDILLDTLDSSLDAAREFYQDAERRMPAAALLAPISGLHRIDDLRAGLRYPERLVGLHIIEPWNRGSVAELVATGPLSKEVRRLRDWAVELGKSCLPVPDAAGGLVMRVWLPALNEAGLLVKEGVPVERIDHAMRRFGMSFGPCEWMDRLGIDHVASLISALQPVFAGRIKLESGFALMVEKGWLGAKAEAGFYRSGWRKKQANPEAIQLWKTQSAGEVARPAPTLSQADSVAWIQRRLVTLTVLEAARCLVEGHVKNGDDLDCALCLTGWASHRGGPIGHGRQLGADALSEMCADLAREYGPRYEAPERLRIALHTGDFSGN